MNWTHDLAYFLNPGRLLYGSNLIPITGLYYYIQIFVRIPYVLHLCDTLKTTEQCGKSWVSAGLNRVIFTFPTASECSSNMHGNRGGSMFDRVGRGLYTHPLFFL